MVLLTSVCSLLFSLCNWAPPPIHSRPLLVLRFSYPGLPLWALATCLNDVNCFHGFSYCLCSDESHTFISSPGFLPITHSHMSSGLLDISMWMPTSLRQFVLFSPHTISLPLLPSLTEVTEIQPPWVKTSVTFLRPLVQWLTKSFHSWFS